MLLSLPTMLRSPANQPPRLLRKFTPLVQRAALGSLLAVAGAGLACSSTDGSSGANGGQGTAGAAPIAGSGAGGAAAGSAGAPASGGAGASGVAGAAAGSVGSGTAGAAPSGGAGGSVGTAGTGGGGAGGGGGGATKWVGTWTGSPYTIPSDGMPPSPLSNAVVRQVAHVSLGGASIRVQFSNLVGNGPVTIKSAHVALCKSAVTADSTIDTATDKALAFSGMEAVTIAQGQEVWSDAIALNVPALANVTITTAFGAVPSTITGHSGSRTTSYVKAASTDVSAADMASAQPTDHWYYISGIDVMADASAKAVVAIGDSITDGRGTDTNKNNRWTDVLASRLQKNAATANVAVMNQGIGATNLVGTGTAAQARFARDVLGQSGVKYAIVYDGVNDIGNGSAFAPMKAVYDAMISAAHAKNVLVYGATIPPFGGNAYYSVAHEDVRKQVNTYIKSGVFDGVIDFDTALTDGASPPKLQATFAAWSQMDGLHPGPAGYQKMGETPDLMLFTK